MSLPGAESGGKKACLRASASCKVHDPEARTILLTRSPQKAAVYHSSSMLDHLETELFVAVSCSCVSEERTY